MNTTDLQHLKMAWLAAKEAGDTHRQVMLLREHPEAQADLADFIAAYTATEIDPGDSQQVTLLLLTQRASQTALERVFGKQLAAANLQELRARRGLTMVSAARGLRLSVDVWKKFESGAIELVSLSEQQLERLAHFFQISRQQFSALLTTSQPTFVLNRRQTDRAARSEQQSPGKQTFSEAVEKSTMTKEEKRYWLG